MGLMLKLFAASIVILAIWIAYSIREPHFDEGVIKGKRVLITGASSGIGEQLAYQYARLGATVVITARREELLRKVANECQWKAPDSDHSRFYYIKADMTKPDDVLMVYQFAVEKMGGLDHLILNHAFLSKFDVWTGSQQNLTMIRKMMEVNFQAFVHMASHAMPELAKSRGSIAIVSSAAGKYPVPYMTAYSASKHALNGFFGGLRHDFKMADPPIDVSITYCNLGLIATESGRNLFEGRGLGYVLDLARAVTPSDTAYAILKGTSLRQREIFVPRFKQLLEFLPIIKELFSQSIDGYMVDLFKGVTKKGIV